MKPVISTPEEEKRVPLNAYISQAGYCSRRQAVLLIKEGQVKVNGRTVTSPAYRVQENDKVTVKGKHVKPNTSLVYIVLNKPPHVITTARDEQNRPTVMDLIGTLSVRVYPVGRLDTNTTGLLLLTNDGELAQRLSHPRYEVDKKYRVTLNRAIPAEALEHIRKGIVLSDGPVQVNEIEYVYPTIDNEIFVRLHSGKNRIIRRIFESLGYFIKQLDRVEYAGLTKRGLAQGAWRYLSHAELERIKRRYKG